MTKTFFRIAAGLSFAATLLVANDPLQAGEITGFTWSVGIASVALEPVVAPPDPNNDDFGDPLLNENKIVVTQKDYTSIGPVDIEFSVVNSGGVTEYVMYEGVSNSTGIDWSEYRILLGFGMGSSFVPSPSGDGLDFDATSFNSPPDFSAFFSTVTEAEDEIYATGGTFPNGLFTVPEFRFSIDVPDGITSFTVRQIPTAVPEPGAIALAMLGCMSLTVLGRRRTAQRKRVPV